MLVSATISRCDDTTTPTGELLTLYIVQVQLASGRSYILPKRYSEFSQLYKVAKDSVTSVDWSEYKFPNKSLFSNSAQFTKERRIKGFDELLKLLSRFKPLPSVLKQFLNLDDRTLAAGSVTATPSTPSPAAVSVVASPSPSTPTRTDRTATTPFADLPPTPASVYSSPEVTPAAASVPTPQHSPVVSKAPSPVPQPIAAANTPPLPAEEEPPTVPILRKPVEPRGRDSNQSVDSVAYITEGRFASIESESAATSLTAGDTHAHTHTTAAHPYARNVPVTIDSKEAVEENDADSSSSAAAPATAQERSEDELQLHIKKEFPRIALSSLKTGFITYFLLVAVHVIDVTRSTYKRMITTALCVSVLIAFVRVILIRSEWKQKKKNA